MKLVPLIDCHSHIEPEWLAHEGFVVRQLAQRSATYGIETVVVSIDCSSGQPELGAAALAKHFGDSGVRLALTLGFSPPASVSELPSLGLRLKMATDCARSLADKGALVGIGECGLDYFWPALRIPTDFGHHSDLKADSVPI